MCERELETEQNCNILTLILLAIIGFLSCSPGQLNRGPGGPAALGHVLIPASSLQLVWSLNWLIGGLRAPSARCWLSLPHLVSNWLNFLCTELYNSSTFTFCCILTFDSAKHAIPKTVEVHIPLAWANLADKMGQGKIPRYSHRLMHRKRVTCKLYDSYFRLMTIKHAIPKIEWAIELLYNLVKTGSQSVWRPVWRPDPLLTRCGRGSQHSAESWAPGPPVEQHQGNGKETLMAIRVGVNMLQFCSVSNSLSHSTFQIK